MLVSSMSVLCFVLQFDCKKIVSLFLAEHLPLGNPSDYFRALVGPGLQSGELYLFTVLFFSKKKILFVYF